MLGGIPARRRGLLLVFIATVLWSTAGFFARLIDHLDLWTMLCGRAFFGGLFIVVAGVFEWRRGVLGPYYGLGPLAPPIIALSAIAITSYIAAIKTTTVAEVMVIYATLPFVTAGLAFLVSGERTTRRTLIAAGVALAGVLVMVASAVGTGRLVGQAIAFAMTAAFGLMIVLQRRHPSMSMTSINAMGAFLAAAVAFGFSPHPALTPYDLGVLAVFGLATVCVAFILFMEGAKHIPAAEAGLISMLDVVLGPLWVLLAFGEKPGALAIVGGALVLGALIWRMAPELRRDRPRGAIHAQAVQKPDQEMAPPRPLSGKPTS
jgi:drug/metabolite transporter (DMT)-like permease